MQQSLARAIKAVDEMGDSFGGFFLRAWEPALLDQAIVGLSLPGIPERLATDDRWV
jgi:hypothetical protein